MNIKLAQTGELVPLTPAMILEKSLQVGDVVIPTQNLFGKIDRETVQLFSEGSMYEVLGYAMSQFQNKPALSVMSEYNPRLIFFSDDKDGIGGAQFFKTYEPSAEHLLTGLFDERIPRLILGTFSESKSFQALGIDPNLLIRLVLEKLPFMSSKERKLKYEEVRDVIEYLKKRLNWLVYDPYKKNIRLTEQGAVELRESFPENLSSQDY